MVWSARSNLTWKLTPKTDLQAFANYRAPLKTEGGEQTAFVFMNFGARYKVWGEQGGVAVRVADPFNLMKWGFTTANGQVVELTERRFGQRALFISLTRNFGQQVKLRPRQQDDQTQTAPPSPGGP